MVLHVIGTRRIWDLPLCYLRFSAGLSCSPPLIYFLLALLFVVVRVAFLYQPEALGQPARDGHCSKPSQLNGLETAGGGPGVCVGSCDSRTLGTRAGVESFIGLHDRKQLKTVKTALESLGLFDKTRKVQQIQLDEHNKFSSEITPQPPSGCTWLALLPVRGPVNAASLPLDMRASLVLNPGKEEVKQSNTTLSPQH